MKPEEYFEEDDLVMYRTPDGNIKSCGFDVNSILLKQGKKPMYTLDNKHVFMVDDEKQQVSDLFKNLAIPAGLFYTDMDRVENSFPVREREHEDEDEDEDEEISEDIYEKLLSLVTEMEKKKAKRGTKKRLAVVVLGGKRKSKKNKKNKN